MGWADDFGDIDALNAVPFIEKHKKAVAWLENYKGDFPFYASLKKQLNANGWLSEKQLASVYKGMEREKDAIKPAAVTFVKVGALIRVKKYYAFGIATKAGMANPHFIFEVVEAKRETPKAVLLVLKMSAQRTTHCCRCGLLLTHPVSVKAGIGPVCAANAGLEQGEGALEGLRAQLEGVALVETWLPKSAIIEIKPA